MTTAERRPQRESKPSTQHPHRTHRTHDTTDQWRKTFGGWGEGRRFGLLTQCVTETCPEWRASCVQVMGHFSKENNAFLRDMDSLCSHHHHHHHHHHHQEVFQQVFQYVFQNVFQEIVRKVFQEVFQKVFQKVRWQKKTLGKSG